MALYSCDLVATLTALLVRISGDHEQPALHTATFVGARGQVIVAVLHPVLASLRAVLHLVIQCRDSDYRDLTCVPALLRTYTLLSVVPASSLYYRQARAASRELEAALLTFSQPSLDLATGTVAASLWSRMMGEVVQYATSSPQAYTSGLSLLSALLPLPHPPCPALSAPRKLWSAHLHSLGPGITSLVGSLAGLAHPPLTALLERVCLQLASLAPPSASLVVARVLEDLPGAMKVARVEARLLHFLAWCCRQPLLKAALCSRLREDRASVVSLLERCLTRPGSGGDGQEAAVAACGGLLDTTVRLGQGQEEEEAGLADCLPDRESVTALQEVLLAHLASDSSQFSSLGAALRLLEACCREERYLGPLLQAALLTGTSRHCLAALLRRLAVELSPSSPSVLSCLSSCLSLLSVLEPAVGAWAMGLAVAWVSGEDSREEGVERRRTHPLAVLANRLREAGAEEGEHREQLAALEVRLADRIVLLAHLEQTVYRRSFS